MSTQGRKHHELGASSEAMFFWQAQHGCQASMSRLMVQHEGLVQAAVRRQVLGELPFTEALLWLRHPIHSQTLRSLVGCHSAADNEWADGQAQRWLRQRGGRHG